MGGFRIVYHIFHMLISSNLDSWYWLSAIESTGLTLDILNCLRAHP